MPRMPTIGRLPAIGRQQITVPRKVIPMPPPDGKKRVVLDTGILIAALIAKKRRFLNSAPYQIIDAFNANLYHLMMNANLLSEYERVLQHQASEGKINSSDINPLMHLVREKGYFGRMFVDKPINTHKGQDDLLFDGSGMLGGDYLVTMDMGDLKKFKKDIRVGSLKIVGPREFLKQLNSS